MKEILIMLQDGTLIYRIGNSNNPKKNQNHIPVVGNTLHINSTDFSVSKTVFDYDNDCVKIYVFNPQTIKK